MSDSEPLPAVFTDTCGTVALRYAVPEAGCEPIGGRPQAGYCDMFVAGVAGMRSMTSWGARRPAATTAGACNAKPKVQPIENRAADAVA
jgi:hypothetical protein